MSFLRLTDVSKFYGSTQAVTAMNLSVEKGEFVSLLGPSGHCSFLIIKKCLNIRFVFFQLKGKGHQIVTI